MTRETVLLKVQKSYLACITKITAGNRLGCCCNGVVAAVGACMVTVLVTGLAHEGRVEFPRIIVKLLQLGNKYCTKHMKTILIHQNFPGLHSKLVRHFLYSLLYTQM